MVGENQKMKVAIVSGASHALKYKEQNPRATDAEILQHVTRITNEILKKIESDEVF